MKRTLILLSLSTLPLTACEGTAGREVRGRLDLGGTAHTADTLIAVDDLGRREPIALEADGSFQARLDLGRTYGLGFYESEARRRGALAQLVLKDSSGWRSSFRLEDGPTLELGVIRPASREIEQEIELEHPRPEPGDDDGGQRRDCRDLGDDGSIAVVPAFLVVGELEPGDDSGLGRPSEAGALVDRDGDLQPDPFDDDADGDGICDPRGEDDDAGVPGDDGDAGVPDADDERDDSRGRADLPYAIEPALGSTVRLTDAFLEKGPRPARVLSVEMEAPRWRYEELSSDTPFVVTQADCDHEGNRDRGRDRIYVAWENADGSRELDHLDLRYCKD